MKTIDFLKQHKACRNGAKWALAISDDMVAVWDAMLSQEKWEWLIWTATRPGVFSDSILRKLACRFVRETPLSDGRTVWDLLTDERSRKAVEVTEAYADGKATKEDLEAARAAAADAAAYTAADAAAYTAACAAAHAAAYDAAYDADADAAAYTAAAARDAAYTAAYAADADAYEAAADDAKAAQAQMIAEMGNPFKKED